MGLVLYRAFATPKRLRPHRREIATPDRAPCCQRRMDKG